MIHAGSQHDELVALTRRVMLDTPEPDVFSREWAEFRATLQFMAKRVGPVPAITYEQFCNHYSGKLKTRYEQAAKSLLEDPVALVDARVSMFVKPEKWHRETFMIKPPRAIQARTPRYNCAVGVYLKPIEQHLYKIHDRSGEWLPRTRCICKGLNSVKRAALANKKLAEFDDPVIIPADASKFDAHVHAFTLAQEHLFYLAINPSAEFKDLLSWQINNFGRTKSGVKYWVDGRRMSGDMNTALGNCVLMVAMMSTMLRLLKLKRWDLLDDGDDCWIIVERGDVHRVQETIPIFFDKLGFTMSVGEPVDDKRLATFCQCRLTKVGGQWRFLRDWQKVINHAFCSNRHYTTVGGFRVMRAIVDCEMALNNGVPILHEFCRVWQAKLAHLKAAKLSYDEGVYRRFLLEGPIKLTDTISDRSRVAFERTWGVTPEQQKAIEQMIRLDCASYPLTLEQGLVDQRCLVADDMTVPTEHRDGIFGV